MNRVKQTAKRWKEARPYVTAIKEQNRKIRNGRRQPKPAKPEGKI